MLKLGEAYDILKNDVKRRAYDLKRKTASPQSTQAPYSSSVQTPHSVYLADRLRDIQRSRNERAAQSRTRQCYLEPQIFELQRRIRRLEQEIANLDSIVMAEVAFEARKNSWKAWFLSPLYQKVDDTEEEQELKDRGRQERRIEKDMKERRLAAERADLERAEMSLAQIKDEAAAADAKETSLILELQRQIRVSKQSEELAKQEKERQATELKQRQEREKQRAEQEKKRKEREAAASKRRAAAEQRQSEEHRKWQEGSNTQKGSESCQHGGWWPKIQGRASCPTCGDSWTYLLQCPGCEMNACPKCQAGVRPRKAYRSTHRYYDFRNLDEEFGF